MSEMTILPHRAEDFAAHLRREEKSPATVSKYTHDALHYIRYLEGRPVTREENAAYRQHLAACYAPAGANSMIAAVNAFLSFLGWPSLRIRRLRLQKKVYCPESSELSREDYEKLVRTARRSGNTRLSLLLQTLCATGIRVSELSFITAEAVRAGEATVSCKGKTRTVFLVRELRQRLLKYAGEKRIETGPLFVTRTGRPLNRSNIWKEMKALCRRAGVSEKKVFPHNLRHLFARTFYTLEKDIARLADILGHSSINTTRIYTISSGAEHRRKLENMHLLV